MRHFPVFLDLHGRRALLLGAGESAGRQAALLRAAGAEVVPRASFHPADLAGCAIAVGVGAVEAELQALAAAARAAGVPVNVVDRPDLCTCIMPAIVDRDPITVAVSSGGAAPVLARLIRARIEAAVPPAFGRLAAFADAFKIEIRRRFPDLAARRRVLEALFAGRTADLVFAGREAEAGQAFAEALQNPAPAGGQVFLVGAGPGAADLLTLRAQRLLGEADVIVHDADVGAAVLDLARRDAEWLIAAGSAETAGLLVALASDGRRIVRLVVGSPDPAGEEASALARSGVLTDIVPGIPTR
jgi:uroporphyrin-III C-methyltransferase / precorrin-2 dehydrogenase / sirohydrochlorin ferrochelatase